MNRNAPGFWEIFRLLYYSMWSEYTIFMVEPLDNCTTTRSPKLYPNCAGAVC